MLINLLNNLDEFKYKRIIVNDINSNIINFYKLLRDDYKYLKKELAKIEKEYNSLNNLSEKQDYYYGVREIFNRKANKRKTVLFLFLMKAGFNGVYRENAHGSFNVPFGKKEIIRFDYENLKSISSLIKDVEFYNVDYIELFKDLKSRRLLKSVFVYCDPPYLPEDLVINKKQNIYTSEQFDHEMFSSFMRNLKNASCMISMTDSEISNKIYKGFKKNTARELIRSINPNKCFVSTEVVFCNYSVDKWKK